MDRYEANLLEANPDASKVAELVNIFTLLKRILEIQDLQHKLLKNESAPANDQSPDSFVLHSALFGDGISSSSENEPDE